MTPKIIKMVQINGALYSADGMSGRRLKKTGLVFTGGYLNWEVLSNHVRKHGFKLTLVDIL